MKSFTLAAVSALASTTAAVTGKLGDATIINHNPIGASYYLYFPNSVTNPIRGSISASSNPSGVGVGFSVNIANLPEGRGPFTYHIHAFPVPADGNCEATLDHLDPFERGETPQCDATQPQTCQVGDLSGKHGSITELSYVGAYTDLYTSLIPGMGSFFGNRSAVIHDRDGNRLTCANFMVNSPGIAWPNSTTPYPNATTTRVPPTSTGTNVPPPPTSTPTNTPTAGAAGTMVSFGAVLAAVFAFLL